MKRILIDLLQSDKELVAAKPFGLAKMIGPVCFEEASLLFHAW